MKMELTRMRAFRSFLSLAAALPLLLVVTACDMGDGEPESLEARAQARWNAMVETDFARAWSFYTPGFREQIDQETYVRDMKQRPVEWLEASVLESSCESENKCRVQVSVRYQAQAPGVRSNMEVRREVEDEWIRLDGQWWYVKN
jgi:hypothetical protein